MQKIRLIGQKITNFEQFHGQGQNSRKQVLEAQWQFSTFWRKFGFPQYWPNFWLLTHIFGCCSIIAYILGWCHTLPLNPDFGVRKAVLSIVYRLNLAGHNLIDHGKNLVVVSQNPQDYGSTARIHWIIAK